MENFVISIGRQIGAGGLETARKLSKEFSIKMYDKEILQEVAAHSGLSTEVFDRSDEKVSKRGLNGFFGIRLFSHLNESLATADILSDDQLFKMQSDVIRNIAERESCIFVGRCADYILRDYPRIITVFITADIDTRVNRMVQSHGWTEDEALRYIEVNERKRADYYNYFTFKKWGDSSSYDLCLDSARLGGTDNVVETVKYVMHQMKII